MEILIRKDGSGKKTTSIKELQEILKLDDLRLRFTELEEMHVNLNKEVSEDNKETLSLLSKGVSNVNNLSKQNEALYKEVENIKETSKLTKSNLNNLFKKELEDLVNLRNSIYSIQKELKEITSIKKEILTIKKDVISNKKALQDINSIKKEVIAIKKELDLNSKNNIDENDILKIGNKEFLKRGNVLNLTYPASIEKSKDTKEGDIYNNKSKGLRLKTKDGWKTLKFE